MWRGRIIAWYFAPGSVGINPNLQNADFMVYARTHVTRARFTYGMPTRIPPYHNAVSAGASTRLDKQKFLVNNSRLHINFYEIMGKFQDFTGQRVGGLTVISKSDTVKNRIYWKCVCSCERAGEVLVEASKLKRWLDTEAAVCCKKLRAKELKADADKSTYAIWSSMRGRCYNPNNPEYPRYGARGIVVCDRWHYYENFVADMGLRPVGLSIERKNNDGNYEPNNCTWVTAKEQARNRRSNKFVTYRGETRILIEWCELLNLPFERMQDRLTRAGWTPEKAFETPIQKRS